MIAAIQFILNHIATTAPGPVAERAHRLMGDVAKWEAKMPALEAMAQEWEEYQAREAARAKLEADKLAEQTGRLADEIAKQVPTTPGASSGAIAGGPAPTGGTPAEGTGSKAQNIAEGAAGV